MTGPRFYLGAHQPHWLGLTAVPLFVSHRRLGHRTSLPRARGPWALDSGGFTELNLHGRWTVPAREYATAARRYAAEVGNLEFAAIQDWMCEAQVLQRTGLSIEEHQRRSVASFLELRSIAPDVPWLPVLQGWTTGCYLRCLDLYAAAGVDLTRAPLVGLGTVCRRQGTATATRIVQSLVWEGLRLHLFGFKTLGLEQLRDALAPDRGAPGEVVSADSMAWSTTGRRDDPLPGHDQPGPDRPRGHINCANCLEYALRWRDRLLKRLRSGPGSGPGGRQLDLFTGAAA